ncbi:hypothetical protein FRACYDRAFT_246027 [Fragilariopsis cylindrus CCMP1102]|uniref:Uncharacterized protein n=1 Tax=Fragilariopsis cylindrus CCMP1102 TaxID=635003 RepID=A0A1E7F0U5_9STRA|nr:hypothetical protein FRACYDRAFT_246027 [Fragilariopsis cylindrus CCMP1102]|eukprot:OEU11433.1 hypothetical protein FRACYDRAFT_246027 [Fragilariopsis cylindrus CCMP1102]
MQVPWQHGVSSCGDNDKQYKVSYSMNAVTYAAEADATNNIRGRNLEEDAKVEGVRCCKKNDTQNCDVRTTGSGKKQHTKCYPIGDSGESCWLGWNDSAKETIVKIVTLKDHPVILFAAPLVIWVKAAFLAVQVVVAPQKYWFLGGCK